MSFDKAAVLERIIEDAPVLSNLRGEVTIIEDAATEKKKVVQIYAYYMDLITNIQHEDYGWPKGILDPELTYDMIKGPIMTTPDATIAEVYSVFEGDIEIQKRREQEMQRKQENKKFHAGPIIEFLREPRRDLASISKWITEEEIRESTRKFHPEYKFHNSANAFMRHFNTITKALEYNLQCMYQYGDGPRSDTFAFESRRALQYTHHGQLCEHNLPMRIPLKIDLKREDPTIGTMLNLADEAYQKMHNEDLSQAMIYLE